MQTLYIYLNIQYFAVRCRIIATTPFSEYADQITQMIRKVLPKKKMHSTLCLIFIYIENMSMEDAWNAILASGSAKPVKLKKSVKQDRIPERVVPKSKVKNSDNGRKKKEKQAEKMEERVEGWRRRDALVIAHDDLSRRAEAFIKKQHDYLKLQREESDRRRLLERMHISENAF